MPIPYIRITERPVLTSPVNINPRNRMAVVGEFSSGPANVPLLISSISDFTKIYRSDTKKGSLAFQAAYDQLTNPQDEDFVLVRVLGHEKQAAGSVVFSGTAAKRNTLNLSFTYVGEVNNSGSTALLEEIQFNDVYTGSVSGRYYFYVDDISLDVATVKYVFKNLTDNNPIDWVSVTDSISVNLTSDQFNAIAVEDGLTVRFGISGQTSDLSLVIGNEFYVRVNKYNFTVDINIGDTPYIVAVNLQNAIAGIDPIGATFLTTENDGLIFRAASDLYPGISGNSITYDISLTDNVSPGITVTQGGAAFIGGVDGPQRAYADLYDIYGNPLVRIQAKYEGTYGNNISFNVNYLSPGKFTLTVIDNDGRRFNPAVDNDFITVDLRDSEDDGLIRASLDSNLVDIIFLPKFLFGENYDINTVNYNPERLAPINPDETDVDNPQHPSFYGINRLREVFLSSGTNGPALEDQDYIDAISTLDNVAVNFVLAAGQYSNAVRQALITHCETKTEQDGLRIAILAASPNLRPSAARAEVAQFDSRYAVMVVGWTTYGGQPNAPRLGTEAAAYYLGKMVSIPFYMSPAYKVGTRAVRNVIEADTDTYTSKQFLDRFEEENLEILSKSKVYNGYYFMTGKVLTVDNNWNRIYVRRAYNQVRSDLYDLLEQYTAAPYRRETVLQIITAINTYFLNRMTLGEIASFKNAEVANRTNFNEDYQRGFLALNVGFLPLSALNFIEVSIFRDDNGGVVIQGL